MRSCQGEHFANIVVLNEVLGYGRQLHQLQFEPVLPVDILLHVAGHVKVEDMLHVGDVKTLRRYCHCNNDWRLANLQPETSLSREKTKSPRLICIECGISWIRQGWIKSRLPVLFRTDSFKTQIDYRQFQKFWLVMDSFGPNRWEKYELKSFCILIYQPLHTPESLLYWKSNASWWYSSTLLENIELCFWTFWYSFRKISIDSFEDFLVDQDRQFQNTQIWE